MNWVYAQIFVRNSVLRSSFYMYIEPAFNFRQECIQFVDILFQRLPLPLEIETLCPVTLTHQIVISYSNVYSYTSHTYFAPFLCFFSKGLIYYYQFLRPTGAQFAMSLSAQSALWSSMGNHPNRNSRFYLLALSHACDIAD